MRKYIIIGMIFLVLVMLCACGKSKETNIINLETKEMYLSEDEENDIEDTTSELETSTEENIEESIEEDIEEIYLSKDINEYVNDDYFDIKGYLNANGATNITFYPIEEEHGFQTILVVGFKDDGLEMLIHSGYNEGVYWENCGDKPTNADMEHAYEVAKQFPRANEVYMLSRNDGHLGDGYSLASDFSDAKVLQTEYEAFYIHSDKLYILEHIVNNKDMFNRDTCPFAGTGISHRELQNYMSTEHND